MPKREWQITGGTIFLMQSRKGKKGKKRIELQYFVHFIPKKGGRGEKKYRFFQKTSIPTKKGTKIEWHKAIIVGFL